MGSAAAARARPAVPPDPPHATVRRRRTAIHCSSMAAGCKAEWMPPQKRSPSCWVGRARSESLGRAGSVAAGNEGSGLAADSVAGSGCGGDGAAARPGGACPEGRGDSLCSSAGGAAAAGAKARGAAMGRPLPPFAPCRLDPRAERGLRVPLSGGAVAARPPRADLGVVADSDAGRSPAPDSAEAGGRGSAAARLRRRCDSDLSVEDPAVEVEGSGVPDDVDLAFFFPFLLGVPLSPALALRGAGFAGEAFGDGGRFEAVSGAAEGVDPDGDALGDARRRGDMGGACADRGACCCCCERAGEAPRWERVTSTGRASIDHPSRIAARGARACAWVDADGDGLPAPAPPLTRPARGAALFLVRLVTVGGAPAGEPAGFRGRSIFVGDESAARRAARGMRRRSGACFLWVGGRDSSVCVAEQTERGWRLENYFLCLGARAFHRPSCETR